MKHVRASLKIGFRVDRIAAVPQVANDDRDCPVLSPRCSSKGRRVLGPRAVIFGATATIASDMYFSISRRL
ncbi:MAG: hypothetical protein ACP6IT_09285, partial [Candidatus Thorarchaeota archaeon]